MIVADPFSILTVVVAPAVLTNASSVLALNTNNRLARVADRSHALTAQLTGARDHEVTVAARHSANARSTVVTSASLFLFGSRTVRQFCSHLDRRFYRGLLRLAIGISNSSWNWRRVWSIRGHRAGLRLCPDDSRNAACSQRLSLRRKISHRLVTDAASIIGPSLRVADAVPLSHLVRPQTGVALGPVKLTHDSFIGRHHAQQRR
jgi:hypothetical protein